MDIGLLTRIILLVLVVTVYMIQATIVQNIYKKTEPGKNITGKLGAELTTQSEIECSRRCRGIQMCTAYQYTGTGTRNCLLIQPKCSDPEGPTFEQGKDDVIFEKVISTGSSGWTAPKCWTGPQAALYQSFDGSNGLVLMEGTEEASHIPLVVGKINFAWNLNQTLNQWVDIGIHTEVCMARPETCGATGGAVSLWVNVVECSFYGGIVSSESFPSKTAVQIFCLTMDIMFRVPLPYGSFLVVHQIPTGWTHIVLNYIGPNDQQGIRIYYDGREVANDTIRSEFDISAGDGRIVVGRYYTNRDEFYASVQVDELIFFNKSLSTNDIEILYNTV